MARLQDRYQKEILPKLKEKLGRQNVMSLPKLQKIVVNMGVGKALEDKNRMQQAAEQLTSISAGTPACRANAISTGFAAPEPAASMAARSTAWCASGTSTSILRPCSSSPLQPRSVAARRLT